jgi:hypothetical protein
VLWILLGGRRQRIALQFNKGAVDSLGLFTR